MVSSKIAPMFVAMLYLLDYFIYCAEYSYYIPYIPNVLSGYINKSFSYILYPWVFKGLSFYRFRFGTLFLNIEKYRLICFLESQTKAHGTKYILKKK